MPGKRKATPSPAPCAKRVTRSSTKAAMDAPSTTHTNTTSLCLVPALLADDLARKAPTPPSATHAGIELGEWTRRRSPRFRDPTELFRGPGSMASRAAPPTIAMPPALPPATQLGPTDAPLARRQVDALLHVIWGGGATVVVGGCEAMLSHVAITRQRTANDFFRLRLVQDSPVAWSIWSCWGPVGDVGECEKEGPWQSLEHAESAFCQRFQAKTKNKWADRHQFEVKPGAYGIVDLDNGRHRSAVAAAPSLAESHRPQQGVRVFFDAWDGGVHLDMKCMPLGTLSARQIEKGMAVLDALRGCVDSGSVLKSMFQSLSAHFYQIIPHASPLVVLSTRKQLNTKHGMLCRLHGLVTGATIENAMRSHRMMTPSSLHCDLDTVTRMDSMHPVIIKYISNGGGDMAKVVGIWSIRRHAEALACSAFATIPNHQLLWHGTREVAVAPILKSGMRIMGNCSATFGRGIYLATMFEKAKQHSTPARVGGRSVGFAFLVEAAIGHALVVPKYGLVGTLPAEVNTVLVKGRRFPNPTEDEVVCMDGQDVRVGIGSPTTDPANPLYHDEVVVYDERLVQLRYVVAFDM